MQRLVLLFFGAFYSLIISSQVLRGNIVKTNGNPVSFATIYIHENTSGIIADQNGAFQVRLKTGNYTCEFRSIGFQTQTKTIEMTSTEVNIRVVLSEKIQNLNEIVVYASKEDPAYGIMRKTISRAPYHLYQVAAFSSENYLKGSAKIESLPGLMKMMIRDKKVKSLIGKLFVLESQNEISYQSPTKYSDLKVNFCHS